MFELVKLKALLTKYESIFIDIIGDMKIDKVTRNHIIFESESSRKLKGFIHNDSVSFVYIDEGVHKYTIFPIPSQNDFSDIKVTEFVKEIRENGCIVEKNTKVYDFSTFSHDERCLVDLFSKRNVFDQDISIFDVTMDEYDEIVRNHSLMETLFESHFTNMRKPFGEARWYTDSIYSTCTLLDGEDISRVYDIVQGNDKISRIYDLYHGRISQQNEQDVFSIHLGLLDKNAFGYKEIRGITKQEDQICGPFRVFNPYHVNYDIVQNLIQNRIGYSKTFDHSNLVL